MVARSLHGSANNTLSVQMKNIRLLSRAIISTFSHTRPSHPFPLNVNGTKLDGCRSYPTISNSYCCYSFPIPYINIALLHIFHLIEQNSYTGHLLHVIPCSNVSHLFYVSVKLSKIFSSGSGATNQQFSQKHEVHWVFCGYV